MTWLPLACAAEVPAPPQNKPAPRIEPPRTYWFTGTVFDYDPQMGARQCLADPDNCGNAYLGLEKLVEDCRKRYTNCVTGRWYNPNWHPERVVFSPDDSHLLVTVCRNDDRQRCTLRRYWIDAARWDDLPGLEPGRYYGWGAYDPQGKRIAVATWKCRDLPRRTPPRGAADQKVPPAGPECGVTDPAFWLLDVNGKRLHALLADHQTPQSHTQGGQYDSRPLAGPLVRSPRFSPDGSKLAYWRMTRAVTWNTRNFSPWSVYELDLASGRERQVEAGHWDYIEGSPVYVDGGRRLAFSAHAFSPRMQNFGEVFVADLAEESPVAQPTHLLDNKAGGEYSRMAIRDVGLSGGMALVTTEGGGQGSHGFSVSL